MRASGVLLPITSLPSKYGIGCLSKEAYQFIDFLSGAKQKYWQILPIGPTGYGDSPYQSFSVFAGNPYFISLEELIKQKLLKRSECEACDFGNDETAIDYDKIYRARFLLLRKAFERSNIGDNAEFRAFLRKNQFWLKDYALFMALKDYFGGKSFTSWDSEIRMHKDSAVEQYQKELYVHIQFYEYLQFEFYNQWQRLKNYAARKNVQIIGDIPIYVAYDSADVWAHPELFQIDKKGTPIAVAGCPPDGFSPTGQLWGNPLYYWDYHKETGYQWWIKRVEKCMELYDVIRIDHFRGFDEYYSIPYGEETAEKGTWKKGPGLNLFQAIRDSLGEVKIIAEDLGYMTDSVRKLVADCGFPNMKVLEFAFDSRDSSGPKEYLPYNYNKNCVVYTGTHDNETLMGFLKSIQKSELNLIKKYVGRNTTARAELADEMIRLAHASVADYCIIPIQDYLHLGNEARINTPSTVGKNWTWRLKRGQLSAELKNNIKRYTVTYGRDEITEKK